jgi:hypothetical protein
MKRIALTNHLLFCSCVSVWQRCCLMFESKSPLKRCLSPNLRQQSTSFLGYKFTQETKGIITWCSKGNHGSRSWLVPGDSKNLTVFGWLYDFPCSYMGRNCTNSTQFAQGQGDLLLAIYFACDSWFLFGRASTGHSGSCLSLEKLYRAPSNWCIMWFF